MRVSTLMPVVAAFPFVFAAPKQPPIKNGTVLPKHYAILAFPSFQPLDIFGPVDVLQSFGMLYNQTDMHLSVIAAKDGVVSSAMSKTPMMGMNHGSFGSAIAVTDTIEEVLAKGGKCGAKPTPGQHGHSMPDDDIEVLIVPGGGGTRGNVTAEVAFVKAMYPKVKYVIRVCTGSTILAKAGILDGKRATSNKRAWTWAISTGPKVNWIGEARWTQDGKIWTSSGIAAGIDATYAWLGHLVGNDVADYLSQSAEYERVTDPNHDPYAKIWDVPSSNSTKPSGTGSIPRPTGTGNIPRPTGTVSATKVHVPTSSIKATASGITYRPSGTGMSYKPTGTGVSTKKTSSKSKKPCGGHGTSSTKVAVPSSIVSSRPTASASAPVSVKPSSSAGHQMPSAAPSSVKPSSSAGHQMPSSAPSSKPVIPSAATTFITIKPSTATPAPSSAAPTHPHGGNYGNYGEEYGTY